MENEEQIEGQGKLNLQTHFEGPKEETTKSSFDLYPKVLEGKQMQPRIMFAIDNRERIMNIALLDPTESNSKEA
jgi:hypothetical protein